jgi:hypothetical protein
MVEMGKGSPKVPGNSPLGAIDLDDISIGTCKSKERGGRLVQLLRHYQIRHFDFRFTWIEKTKAPSGV